MAEQGRRVVLRHSRLIKRCGERVAHMSQGRGRLWEGPTDAAEVCRSCCPLLDLCRDYADKAGERWHVWGGSDRQGREPRGFVGTV